MFCQAFGFADGFGVPDVTPILMKHSHQHLHQIEANLRQNIELIDALPDHVRLNRPTTQLKEIHEQALFLFS